MWSTSEVMDSVALFHLCLFLCVCLCVCVWVCVYLWLGRSCERLHKDDAGGGEDEVPGVCPPSYDATGLHGGCDRGQGNRMSSELKQHS